MMKTEDDVDIEVDTSLNMSITNKLKDHQLIYLFIQVRRTLVTRFM